MSRLARFAIFLLAAVHLLLFSICPVSSRIYETNDAVVIEVDVAVKPPTWSTRNRNYRGNPAAAIPMPYVLNPYNSGLYEQQQPNFLSWFYPLRTNQAPPSSNFFDVIAATKTPESKQQQTITYCGDGPASSPLRSANTTGITPPVVSIVGGTQAIPNSWPFIVGLRISGSPVICGGSLISPTRILTAAHCVEESPVSEIASMTVSLGMHTQGNLPNTVNDAQQTRRVIRAVYHSDYQNFYNDVAVLTIDPPVIYSKDISPVCLPPANQDADQFVGKDAAIMGWGTLISEGDEPNELQQVTVKVISNVKCNSQYAGAIDPQQLCAEASGKDSCQGDSGGPLVVQNSKGSPWTQVGVVSYGRGCADPNFAGVYASVAFFRNWINTYMYD